MTKENKGNTGLVYDKEQGIMRVDTRYGGKVLDEESKVDLLDPEYMDPQTQIDVFGVMMITGMNQWW